MTFQNVLKGEDEEKEEEKEEEVEGEDKEEEEKGAEEEMRRKFGLADINTYGRGELVFE